MKQKIENRLDKFVYDMFFNVCNNISPELQKFERGSELQRASKVELRRSELLRASGIDDRPSKERASGIEHPKFTVHRASSIRSSLCIGHRPPVIAFPRNQRNKKRLKQTSSFVKVKAPTTNATKTKHIFFRHVIYSFFVVR